MAEEVAGVARRRVKALAPKPKASSSLTFEAPPAHLSRAKALLETDPREAIRQGLYALLSTLEQRRWARPTRVKTNRELAEELPTLGAPSELSEKLTRLLGWYDRAFYSSKPVTRPDAERFINEIDALEPSR